VAAPDGEGSTDRHDADNPDAGPEKVVAGRRTEGAQPGGDLLDHHRVLVALVLDVGEDVRQQLLGAELGQGIANMINLLGLSTVVIYGPPNLLGNPRNARMADDSALGENKTAQYFVEAMVYRVRRQALSPGQSDCQLIIRPQSWQTTACASC
jgi:hypothetical protein